MEGAQMLQLQSTQRAVSLTFTLTPVRFSCSPENAANPRACCICRKESLSVHDVSQTCLKDVWVMWSQISTLQHPHPGVYKQQTAVFLQNFDTLLDLNLYC